MPKKTKERLSVKLSPERLQKLRDIAHSKDTTMTHLIEQWIDRLAKPSEEKQDNSTDS